MRASEQVCMSEIESVSYNWWKCMHVYLVANVTDLFIEGLFTKVLNSIFYSKMHNSDSLLKLYIGCIQWTFRYPQAKYVSNWMILNFCIN